MHAWAGDQRALERELAGAFSFHERSGIEGSGIKQFLNYLCAQPAAAQMNE